MRRRFDRLGLPVPSVIVDNRATRLGRPHAAPYLLGAERLGVPAAEHLVIEDSPSGVAAGLAAGMTVWCVNNPEPPEGVHRWYSSLAEAAADIQAMIRGISAPVAHPPTAV